MLIAQQLVRFCKYYKLFYSQKLMSNSGMATHSDLQEGDVVLVTDLASNSGRSSPHPAIGKIISFLDSKNSQAVVRYHNGTVDRPIGKLVRIVKKDEQISPH